MDTSHLEELNAWNDEFSTARLISNTSTNEHYFQLYEPKNFSTERIDNISSNLQCEQESVYEISSYPTDPPDYHERDVFYFNDEYQFNLNHFEAPANMRWEYTENCQKSYNYSGIDLDVMMFQILDVIHQSEGEGVPGQCVYIKNHLTLERLFEMRTYLCIDHNSWHFLEAMLDICKKGIDEQVYLNKNVDRFCVRYLSSLHSKNTNTLTDKGMDPIFGNDSSENKNETLESQNVLVGDEEDSDDYCTDHDDETDSDYDDDIKKRTNSKAMLTKNSKSDASDKKKSKRLSKTSRIHLRKWLEEHYDHPYPSDDVKKNFMDLTGLTFKQINNWFINARRRELPKIFDKLSDD